MFLFLVLIYNRALVYDLPIFFYSYSYNFNSQRSFLFCEDLKRIDLIFFFKTQCPLISLRILLSFNTHPPAPHIPFLKVPFPVLLSLMNGTFLQWLVVCGCRFKPVVLKEEGEISPPKDIWQGRETFLVTRHIFGSEGVGKGWVLLASSGRGQGCC